MGFLKTILFVLLGYYLIKFLARMFAPRILGYAAKKTEQHFRERFEGFADYNGSSTHEQHSDIIINNKKARKNDSSQKVGEYIDFEEID